MKKITKLLALASLSLALTACSKVTVENYQQIKVGMDKAEIEILLGAADKCEAKTLHSKCVWGDESKNITATIVADKVTLYSETGL
jgi:hypothetical protein